MASVNKIVVDMNVLSTLSYRKEIGNICLIDFIFIYQLLLLLNTFIIILYLYFYYYIILYYIKINIMKVNRITLVLLLVLGLMNCKDDEDK